MRVRGVTFSFVALAAAFIAMPASAKSNLNPAQQGFADLISFSDGIEHEFAYPVDLYALEDRMVEAAVAELPDGWADLASCRATEIRERERIARLARNLKRRLGCLRVNALPPSAGERVLRKMIAAAIAGLDGHAIFVGREEIYPWTQKTGIIGVGLEKVAEGVRVVYTLPRSSARRAGIAVGDVVTQIDGRSTSTMFLKAATEALR